MNELILSITIAPWRGGYLATSDDLQGFIVQGRTITEMVEIAQDVVRKLTQLFEEHGDPLRQRSPKLSVNRRNAPRPKFPSGSRSMRRRHDSASSAYLS